jgi:hypothetical protein
MKLTKQQLKQIIKEELEKIMDEGILDTFRKKPVKPVDCATFVKLAAELDGYLKQIWQGHMRGFAEENPEGEKRLNVYRMNLNIKAVLGSVMPQTSPFARDFFRWLYANGETKSAGALRGKVLNNRGKPMKFIPQECFQVAAQKIGVDVPDPSEKLTEIWRESALSIMQHWALTE